MELWTQAWSSNLHLQKNQKWSFGRAHGTISEVKYRQQCRAMLILVRKDSHNDNTITPICLKLLWLEQSSWSPTQGPLEIPGPRHVPILYHHHYQRISSRRKSYKNFRAAIVCIVCYCVWSFNNTFKYSSSVLTFICYIKSILNWVTWLASDLHFSQCKRVSAIFGKAEQHKDNFIIRV